MSKFCFLVVGSRPLADIKSRFRNGSIFMESGQSILATQLALAQNKDLTITVQKKTVATPADVYALLKLAIKARNSSFANV